MSERDLQAAEYALGLLEGEALLEARGLVASDAEFARSVEHWHARLAPLLDEAAEQQPRAELWEKVRAAVAAENGAGSNIVDLNRRLTRWKGFTAAASAIAASLALVVAYDATSPPPPVAVEPQGAPVMVASLMSPSNEIMLSAACQPDGRTLMLMPGKMQPPTGMSYQLWLIPADGQPHSLGMIDKGRPMRMPVDPEMAPMFDESATLALSMEPMSGAPEGRPSGPMVASGPLRKV